MSAFVPVAMFGFIPLVLVAFVLLPARRAVLFSFVAGWLLLPIAQFPIPGLPDYSKVTATSFAAALGAVIFDGRRLVQFRFGVYDAAAAVWCLAPLGSSLTNGLGLWDGLSGTVGQTAIWGLPYLLGRVYLSDLEGMRDLALAVVIGGLIYVPLCLIEVRLSPQLHRWVYGFHQHQFAQSRRDTGGFRPTVFMQHGLAVGMWMTAASLMGVWLWWTGAVRRMAGLPMWMVAGALAGTALLVKSFGAFVLLGMGLAVLWFTRVAGMRLALVVLVSLPLMYVGTRATGVWDGKEMVDLANSVAGTVRGGSLRFRMDNENALIKRALEMPVFGWGGWGRNRPPEDLEGTITDGLWIIAMGQRGLVGLVAMHAMLLGGFFMLLLRVRGREWGSAAMATVAPTAVLTVLYVADNLFNAMINPVFIMAAGGTAGFAAVGLRSMRAGAGVRQGGSLAAVRGGGPGVAR